jgi:integrase
MRKNSQRATASRGGKDRERPSKPTPDFPLFPHATRRWAKKIRGRFVFFGPWDDPYGALDRFLVQKDALLAGSAPPSSTRNGSGPATGPPDDNGTPGAVGGAPGPTVRDLVNQFLTAKQRRLDSGDMGRRSFSDYHYAAKRLIGSFGRERVVTSLSASDFGVFRAKMAKTLGPVALGNEIGRVRSIFKYGYEAGLLGHPVRFGPEFCKPPKRSIRLARRAKSARMFEAAEIQALLRTAGPQMRAMILLGVNCGLGNTDLASLPKAAVDLEGGILDFPRPKTGIFRRAVLWPETVAALRTVLRQRPAAKRPEDDGLVFITRFGHPWLRVTEPKQPSKDGRRAVVTDAISLEFGKLMRSTGAYQPGRGFYGLRHSFRTIADEAKDRPAADLVMGHENGQDMATHYVERISDGRLRSVAELVRGWTYAGL